MAEPITLAEAKKHLRVDSAADDALITDSIVAAREWVENYTGLLLTQREVTESLSGFNVKTRLRSWPIGSDQSITITYRDISGANQTLENAELSVANRPGLIFPAAGEHWPCNSTVYGAVYVTLTAGYATAADVPKVIKQAMLTMLTAFYDDREGGEMFAAAESTAKRLCRHHKRHTL